TVAESIIRTPLFEEVKEDEMVRNYESHGNYTVKSGYKHYIKSKSVDQSFMKEGEWSSLWRIGAPPKTKHLLWRIRRGCLPTRKRLKERNNWVWNGIRDTAKDMAMRAVHMIKEWRSVNMVQQTNRPTTVVTAQIRRSATAEPISESVSRSTVLAEASRKVVEVQRRRTNKCMHKFTAAEGEATAILEAMREAISRRWTNIVFESDSKVVVDAIQANTQGISKLSSIIHQLSYCCNVIRTLRLSSLSDKRTWRLTR
ncbi:pentatricopeptide repeat-containing protein, partial [Trifolium medium]|nr:pentatricopeptide repeat-containing protein [Trifolium medium]